MEAETVNQIPDEYDITSSNYMKVDATSEWEYTLFREQNIDVSSKEDYLLSMSDRNHWYDLSKSFIEVETYLHKSDGSPFVTETTGVEPALITYANDLWNLFSKISLRLGDLRIHPDIIFPGKLHLIKALVYWSRGYAETVGKEQGFVIDTISDINDLTTKQFKNAYDQDVEPDAGDRGAELSKDPRSPWVVALVNTTGAQAQPNAVAQIYKNTDYDEGFAERYEQYSYSLPWASRESTNKFKKVRIRLPVKEIFSFFRDYDKVTYGTTMDIELYKNTNYTDVLQGNVTTDTTSTTPKFTITSLELWVPQLKPSAELKADLLKQITSTRQEIFYRDHKLYNHRFPTIGASQAISWTLPIKRSKALKVYFALAHERRRSNYALNSQQFDHVFRDIYLDVNGTQFPRKAYKAEVYAYDTANLQQNSYKRILADIHRAGAMEYDNDDEAIVTYKNWKDIYPIVVFDLEADSNVIFDDSTTEMTINFVTNENMDGSADTKVEGYAVVESEVGVMMDYSDSKLNFSFI